MATINRIQFTDTNPDPPDVYECPINPVSVDLLDDRDYSSQPVLDGAPIGISSSFDGRQRKLVWDTFEYDDITFQDMRSQLILYENSSGIKLDLKDIDSPGWGDEDIYVDEVRSEIQDAGTGKHRIQLTLTYHYTGGNLT